MAERTILWTVTDPRGLNVTFTSDVWLAVLAKHPDFGEFFNAIATTIQEPEAIYFDPDSTPQRPEGIRMFLYYRSGLLSGKLADKRTAVVVKVVIEQNGEQGYVQTAYPSERILPRLVRQWKK